MLHPIAIDLHAVIEEAYWVFSGYRPQKTLNVCHCDVCIDAESERALLATPLRQISSKLLSRYTDAVSAGTDDVRFDELRYFLPRYLELIAANDPPDDMGYNICLRRLQEAIWRTAWPAEQVAVIERFFDAYLASSLTNVELCQWPAGWALRFPLGDVLTMIATAGGDIERVLRIWEAAPDPGAALHMAALRSDLTGGPEWRLNDAHLSPDFRAAARAIGAFLTREDVDARLETVFFSLEDERHQKIVSDATWSIYNT